METDKTFRVLKSLIKENLFKKKTDLRLFYSYADNNILFNHKNILKNQMNTKNFLCKYRFLDNFISILKKNFLQFTNLFKPTQFDVTQNKKNFKYFNILIFKRKIHVLFAQKFIFIIYSLNLNVNNKK